MRYYTCKRLRRFCCLCAPLSLVSRCISKPPLSWMRVIFFWHIITFEYTLICPIIFCEILIPASASLELIDLQAQLVLRCKNRCLACARYLCISTFQSFECFKWHILLHYVSCWFNTWVWESLSSSTCRRSSSCVAKIDVWRVQDFCVFLPFQSFECLNILWHILMHYISCCFNTWVCESLSLSTCRRSSSCERCASSRRRCAVSASRFWEDKQNPISKVTG